MKKFIALLLVVVLSLTATMAGTMAYLQDTDSDVNVMTLGNVHIAQHEFERVTDANGDYTIIDVAGVNSYELQEFTQRKPLYPFVGDVDNGYDSTEVRLGQLGHNSRGGMSVFTAKNVQDKFVVVENTGDSDAYVRTIVALEAGSVGYDEWFDLLNYSYHFTWEETVLDTLVDINGNNYLVVEFLYKGYEDVQHPNGVLTPGDYTYNNLAQVYLRDIATNEDVEAIDGNGNGTYDILVLSQAVQTQGFADAKTALDTAFGKTADKAAEWLKDLAIPVVDGDSDDVKNAFANGGIVYVDGDVADVSFEVTAGKTTEIDLQGNTMTADYVESNGELTLENGNLTSGTPTDYGVISRGEDAIATLSNVALTSGGGGVAAADGAEVVFNSGSVAVNSASTSGRYLFYTEGAGSTITINDGVFSFSKTLNQKRAYIYADAGTTVYVNGGTFGKASSRSGYTAGILGAGDVIITGGTFGFDPTNWVADGYEAVKTGDNWVVSAK